MGFTYITGFMLNMEPAYNLIYMSGGKPGKTTHIGGKTMKDSEKLRAEILKLKNKGMSIGAIAKTLGVTKPTVRYHLKMAELEQREIEL